MKYTALVLCVLFIFVPNSFAGEMKLIKLKDGSVITGQVVSLRNGSYTIKSDSMGKITISDTKIQSIQSAEGARKGQSEASGIDESQLNALQNQMTSDVGMMQRIASLQNDPDFKKVLSDPAIMKAINSGDINALTSNPKFMKLLNKAAVKSISREVKKK